MKLKNTYCVLKKKVVGMEKQLLTHNKELRCTQEDSVVLEWAENQVEVLIKDLSAMNG